MVKSPPHIDRLTTNCFLVVCHDGDNRDHLRVEHLEGHLLHVEKHWQRYVTAGPVREPEGERIVGSVFLVLADTVEEAKTLMAGDPYITCGLYETVDYKHFTNSIGQFLGGKIWKDVDSVRHRATGGPPTQ